MDIRIQSYSPVTVQSFGGARSAVAVSDARQSGPVAAIAGIQGQSAKPSLAELASQLRQANAGNGGYTDATRGSNINILA